MSFFTNFLIIGSNAWAQTPIKQTSNKSAVKPLAAVCTVFPRIDVRASHIGSPIVGGSPLWHTFIIVTDCFNDEYYYRGGATNHLPPFGPIVVRAGKYGPTAGPNGTPSVDWDPSAPSVTVLHTQSVTQYLTPYILCFSGNLQRINSDDR